MVLSNLSFAYYGSLMTTGPGQTCTTTTSYQYVGTPTGCALVNGSQPHCMCNMTNGPPWYAKQLIT
jgi:hypothetical protein